MSSRHGCESKAFASDSQPCLEDISHAVKYYNISKYFLACQRLTVIQNKLGVLIKCRRCYIDCVGMLR